MADLERRRPARVSRSAKERQAYNLVRAGGAAGALAVVTAVLAIVGILGWGIPAILAVVAVVCALLFRRVVGR